MWLLITVLAASTACAQHAEDHVRTLIESRDRDIKAAIEAVEADPSKSEHARALINERIDFERMGRLALGDYDAELTEDQRSAYVDAFAAIVRSQSLADLSVYKAPVTIESVEVNGNLAYVRTRALVNKARLDVDYLLHRQAETWWLYDFVIDGVGTVEGYAISFQTYIRKRGFDAFMASLHRKLERSSG